MTQLIVSLEDTSMLSEIKQAIRRLKGVVSVNVKQTEERPNDTTVRAISEMEHGQTMVCEDFEAYLKLVEGELPD